MKKLEYLKQILSYLDKPDPEALKLSMVDVHHEGMFSLVINGTEFGKLTRVFIATDELKPNEVQFHTHRYPITLTVLKGEVTHHTAKKIDYNLDTLFFQQDATELSVWDYTSPLNRGKGLSYNRDSWFILNQYILPPSARIGIAPDEFHTMSVSKGSMWIVEEGGFEVESSQILGVPFVLDNLYNEPKGFQVNDMTQKVRRVVKAMILNYELV
jgi:hypothetical protein